MNVTNSARSQHIDYAAAVENSGAAVDNSGQKLDFASKITGQALLTDE